MIQQAKTIGDFVTENIKTAHVFKKHGIDFCCGGGITLEKACEQKGLNIQEMQRELEEVTFQRGNSLNFNKWELSFLIDYIVNEHHTYVRESIPIIMQYAEKVARVHGHNYPEVTEVYKIFSVVAEELNAHLQKEEMVLFPFVKELELAKKENRAPLLPPFGSVNNPIKMMEHEHENAGDAFKEIAQLTNGYEPPMGACNTFRALYAKLEEFEEDLHQHVHLENNILHRKAAALES
ncbi:MAG: iron-sulfur cluster repair di-iron protein [Saprospiraceae bacterium]|nr:iron-sulfur cluster repair di-iron protein [Saprospiraceae bacterium]